MRISCLSYATSQGLAHLMRAFYDHGLITDPVVMRHPSRSSNLHWYPKGTPVVSGRSLRSWGAGLDRIAQTQVLLCFETFFDWRVIDWCRGRGIKTVLMPMYEWTPATLPYTPDLFLNPSRLDQDYFPQGVFLHVPVETKFWKLRTHARSFLHNAGNVGVKQHKGTRQLLEAVKFVKHPDFRLTVRAQDARALRAIVQDTRADQDPRVTIQYGEVPYEQLWDGHDVLVAPEKINGLSLPLQEAFAAGMPVITTDRYPTNTWLPKELLIPVARYEKSRQSAGCIEHDLAVVAPEAVAATLDAWVGQDVERFSVAGKVWAEANAWEALLPKYREVLERLV